MSMTTKLNFGARHVGLPPINAVCLGEGGTYGAPMFADSRSRRLMDAPNGMITVNGSETTQLS